MINLPLDVLKKLTNIRNLPEYAAFLEWLDSLEFKKQLHSSYAPSRLERWFEKGSNLQSILDNRAEIVKYEKMPAALTLYCKKLWSDYDSVLVCKGKKPSSDTSIDWHRDHGHFEAKAVMLNFGTSEYGQRHYSGELTLDRIEDGDIVEIDTKIVHKSTQLSDLRYNVTLRKVKMKYASDALFR